MIWHGQESYKVFSIVEQAYRALAPKGRIYIDQKPNRGHSDIPVMISTSSFVIAAWRPRLYFIWKLPVMSEVFLEALSMALRLKQGRCE